MTEPGYKICNRCVMDTSDPDIVFDESGNCNHCNEFMERTSHRVYRGEETDKALEALVQRMKTKGRKSEYDCVLGISGGIDSCYAAYIAKNLGLRVLAVHMDNGWNSEAAVKNIKFVTGKLGIDYESYVLDWEEFKDLQLSFLKASVPELETPTDIAIPAALHRIATRYKIKYVLSGGNFATEGILPKSWHYNAKDVKFLKGVQRIFGSVKLRTFPLFGFTQEMYFKLVKGIRIIYLLNYVPYSKTDAMQLLEDKLSWKYYGGKHYESLYTGFVQSYILPAKFNIDYRRATLSTQICTGEVSREEALQELTHLSYDPVKVETEKTYIAKKLGIRVEAFDRIMKEPPKSYKDYPNSKKWLEFVYSIYRKIYN